MKWPLLDVQAGSLQSRQALKDARSPSPAHIVVSKRRKMFFLCLKKKKAFDINGIGCHQFSFTQTKGEILQNKQIPNKPVVKGGNTFFYHWAVYEIIIHVPCRRPGSQKCSKFTHCRIT